LLVLLIIPFVSAANLATGEFKRILAPSSLTVTAVSFASLMIIPSLRTYFDGDMKTLRKAILIGMSIPLLCYMAWDMVILGVVPIEGLKEIVHSSSMNSDLLTALGTLLQKDSVTMLAKFFTSICMTTSFLSISLCLSDFLSDGLRVKKEGKGGVFIFFATFLPPLLIILFFPNGFMLGLTFAGVCCFILMNLLPPVMVWRGRYHLKLANHASYRTPGGKGMLSVVILASLGLVGLGFVGLYDVFGNKFLLALPVFFVTLMIGYVWDRGQRDLSVSTSAS
jgi:tyrosine-specific transport protein